MEPPSSASVEIVNSTGKRLARGPISRAVAEALRRNGADSWQVCVLLCDEAFIRRLNKEFRGIDKPTDVLSFAGPKAASHPRTGDIAIAVPVAARQAALRGVSLLDEVALLAVHGALHLVGFGDETEPEREAMAAEMARVCVAAGIAADHEWASLERAGAA